MRSFYWLYSAHNRFYSKYWRVCIHKGILVCILLLNGHAFWTPSPTLAQNVGEPDRAHVALSRLHSDRRLCQWPEGEVAVAIAAPALAHAALVDAISSNAANIEAIARRTHVRLAIDIVDRFPADESKYRVVLNMLAQDDDEVLRAWKRYEAAGLGVIDRDSYVLSQTSVIVFGDSTGRVARILVHNATQEIRPLRDYTSLFDTPYDFMNFMAISGLWAKLGQDHTSQQAWAVFLDLLSALYRQPTPCVLVSTLLR